MLREILFFENTFSNVKEYFSQERVLETGLILLVKLNSSLNHRRFIVFKVIVPKEEDYLQRTPILIVYKPEFMERVFEQCVEHNSHLIEVHTHPFSSHGTTYSGHDDNSDRHLGLYISNHFRNMHFGTIVSNIDMTAMDARMWSPFSRATIPMDRIKIIGQDSMTMIPTTSFLRMHSNRSFDHEIHHRTALALGNAAQQRYHSLKVGIVGCGGLGSIVAELLARLGINSLVAVDHDVVEKTNLSRLTGATSRDAQYKRAKSEVLAREAKKSNPGISVHAIQDNFLNSEVQQSCKSCDIISGCTDSISARMAMNRLCIANGIPYFDLGTGAKVEDGKLVYAGGQAIKVVPQTHNRFCLHCADFFTKENLDLEMMDEDEKAHSVQHGYISGDMALYDRTSQPAVYALNMQVASQAVWWMMRYVSGESARMDGIALDAMNYTAWPWEEEKKGKNDCPICGEHGLTGLGDEAPLMTNCKAQKIPVLPAMEEAADDGTATSDIPEASEEHAQAEPDSGEAKGKTIDIMA